MTSRTTAYAAACAAIGRLLAETGRKAILRSELTPQAPAHACDRALKHYCEAGRLTRVGRGIYGVGAAKVFEIVPEVLPKLGYRILPGAPVRGYSQKSGGAVWRLDRPCRRVIRKRGVQAMFETPDGKLVGPRQGGTMNTSAEQPRRQEIEAHFHRFERCHSLARAEKDLLVRRALVAMEGFRSDRATLAIEGGTALVAYHRMTTRFSEDIDIRLIPNDAVRRMETGRAGRRAQGDRPRVQGASRGRDALPEAHPQGTCSQGMRCYRPSSTTIRAWCPTRRWWRVSSVSWCTFRC